MIAKFAPLRFVIFIAALVIATVVGLRIWPPAKGLMTGFDVASLIFLVSCLPLLNDDTKTMRESSKNNDANRPVLLGISVTVTTVILAVVGIVIVKSKELQTMDVVLIVVTLVLAWLLGNVVYALHYAHLYYASKEDGGDTGGIEFPETKEPDYWDFLYFSFTLGMTFQTSDCAITSRQVRRVSIGHSMAAFIFNLGVLAFTINTLGP